MKQSPRILALIPYKVFPAIMGGQKGIALFYKYLAKELSLTVLTTAQNEPKENYPVYNVLSNSQLRYVNPMIFFAVKKYAKQSDATHVLFEHPYFAWLIVLVKWFTSYGIIVHSHNIESQRFKSVGKSWWKILWYYERLAYRMADQVWFKTNEDKTYAIENYELSSSKCIVIPYGIEQDQLPHQEEIVIAKKLVQEKHQLDPSEKIILFNGTLNYKPNLDALNHILKDVNPILNQCLSNYRILICGKNLPADMNSLKEFYAQHIVYAGFVDDIDLYFKACDLFINPLLDGGGIKTKLVEALGFGKKAVSTVNGAIGVKEACTQGRLKIGADGDWGQFAAQLIEHINTPVLQNNQLFYSTFSWKNIAEKAAKGLY
jgi:glycosyltransferase involved in cell wall biosynthesis